MSLVEFNNKVKPIAMVLPQFHPIPENNQWWGKGFTEWTNVVKTKPLYRGHYQPQLPADLGFYDLRVHEARLAQAELASQYGIYGFCYYHYWFNGKRLLEKPVDDILNSGQPDFPFMLCWANENWTRRWDGGEHEILMIQEYNEVDDVAHMHHLIQYFLDPRYIRINNKPVFVLYKPFLLPNPTETVRRWRSVAAEYGLELYLCHMVFSYQIDTRHLLDGFDAAIDFEPFGIRRSYFQEEISRRNKSIVFKFINIMKIKFGLNICFAKYKLNILPYRWMFENLQSIHSFGFKLYPSIVPGWDNTARQSNNPTLVLDSNSPHEFQKWLEKITNDFKPYSEDENLIFINAWNEWAEGNHLEPCTRWGKQFLEVVRKLIDD
jgi:hypothetical protein